ncbi:hypothetical protein [Cystobacter fuscus]|uniref:hypothetical protein n=1 Tax=Cystobacter fuscus TaxID=43 RepID=UPI0005B92CA8|nr:hypothetical protein [Cystobacter fuscus]
MCSGRTLISPEGGELLAAPVEQSRLLVPQVALVEMFEPGSRAVPLVDELQIGGGLSQCEEPVREALLLFRVGILDDLQEAGDHVP